MRRQTLHEWIKRGESKARADLPYREFAAAVERARAEAESDLVAQMRKASASGSWKATAWLLERVAPERWDRAAKAPAAPAEDGAADPFGEVDQLAKRRAARV